MVPIEEVYSQFAFSTLWKTNIYGFYQLQGEIC
jgi:hypothetical protein